MKPVALIFLSLATLALGQRPFFAGSKPIGYPELTTEALADRFGEGDGTTQRLPVEANGDRDLIDRLSKLPVDKQPFWFINWQALEANRQKPQTYPQKPNVFVDPIANSASGSFNSGSGNFNGNPNSGGAVPSTGSVNTSSGNVNSASQSNGFETSNRFGVEEHPKDQDKIKKENAFTNANTNLGYGKPAPLANQSNDKKEPPKDKYYESYRF